MDRVAGVSKISSKSVVAMLTILMIVGVAVALVLIGKVEIGYRILPGPTFSPDVVSLDLGAIPSGSSGTKDFGSVATLQLAADYEITFELDLNTTQDFEVFNVTIELFKSGEDSASYVFNLINTDTGFRESKVVSAGTYDVYIKVTYTVKEVTAEKSGTVKIYVYYNSS